MTTVRLDIVIDDTTKIATHTDGRTSPAIMLDSVWLSVARDAHEVAVADSLLTAVTEWHAEIHRRAAERAEAGTVSETLLMTEAEYAELGCQWLSPDRYETKQRDGMGQVRRHDGEPMPTLTRQLSELRAEARR